MRHVDLAEFADTLRIYQGSLYVNDFNRFGRTWQVIVQADQQFRDSPEYISRLKVRNSNGVMVPLGSLASVKEVNGPLVLTRYNMYPAASINGMAAPGMSSNQAIEAMERLAEKNLPRNMSFEWTDMSYLELLAGNTASVIFGFAVVMVFLVLAAQYESWSLPLAVILVVPMCLLSALVGRQYRPYGREHLHAHRVCRAGRTGEQERDSDRRIRQAASACGRIAPRSDARRLPAASAANHHDQLCLHPGRRAVDRLARSRCRDAAKRWAWPCSAGCSGVTLFGLALTPVFFFTIDWLSRDAICSRRRDCAQISDFIWQSLSLRPLRRWGRTS